MVTRRSDPGPLERGMDRTSTKNTYRRGYRLRISVPGRNSLHVTFPYEVVEREARRHGLTVDEFIQQFRAVAHYNGFDGVYYTFERV